MFGSSRDGSQQIYTMESDGTNQQRLTTSGSAHSPRWSPDKTKIVFMHSGSIAVMYHDGSNLYLGPDGEDPSFSNDGQQLVFRRSSGLYISDIDGSNATQITSGNDRAPAWHPSSDKIIFERTLPGENSDLWTVNKDGSNEIKLPTSELDERAPKWSPDGTQVTFSYQTDAWVMDSDGTNRVNVGGNGDQSQLTWSPDGSKLAFTMAVSGPYQNEVWVMNADGTGRVNISNHSAHDSMGDW